MVAKPYRRPVGEGHEILQDAYVWEGFLKIVAPPGGEARAQFRLQGNAAVRSLAFAFDVREAIFRVTNDGASDSVLRPCCGSSLVLLSPRFGSIYFSIAWTVNSEFWLPMCGGARCLWLMACFVAFYRAHLR